ncbi:MAG: SDR family oxidoreductase [Candidatus Dormibacteria bacterium]
MTESAPAPPAGTFRLDGRVALVTGGSRGIGRAIVHGLAAAGAHVVVSSRKLEACEAVVAEVTAAGGTALALAANAGRAEEVDQLVATAVERLGRLDVLVNNAAANPYFGPMIDCPADAFEKTFVVNLRGPLVATAAAVRAWMGAHGGSVINVASVAGIRPDPLLGVYSASKAALINATKSLARELGPQRIRVNVIAPGLIRTDFARVLVETPEIHDRFVAGTALGRVGEPEEMAGAVVWLASDAAAYVTGTVISLDGGITA